MTIKTYLAAGISAACLLLACGPALAAKAKPAIASCKLIKTAADLQAMSNGLFASYCLGNDIDAGSIANFVPVGDEFQAFSGKFFGNHHVIRNLTISVPGTRGGLFGAVVDALIQDVGLINAKVTATQPNSRIGILVGRADSVSTSTTIQRVYTIGQVDCAGTASCIAGGIAGVLSGVITLSDSWSGANIAGKGEAGGAVGNINSGPLVVRSYATGSVNGGGGNAGGLVGDASFSSIAQSFASGPVSCPISAICGGLVAGFSSSNLSQSYSTGTVNAADFSNIGGLIGILVDGSVSESYAAGLVITGPSSFVGGLIGGVSGSPVVASSYWDTVTTNQPSSLGPSEVGLTTAQMRAALPAGFGNAWGIVTALSYPLLNDPSIDFASTLATLVRSNKVFTFEPISQLEISNYGGATNHIDQASLAAVYTMIARAVGYGDGVNSLKTAKISKYWKDSKQTAHFSGAVTDHATLGALKTIKANTPIGSQIVNKMRAQNLVILRGTYAPDGGGSATHYMLGTLYTKNPDNSLSAVIANDPWTGWQVAIDPVSKTVVTPNFPLADFKIDGYQPVTIN